MLLQFVFSFFATIGYAVLFNIPKKDIVKASFAGACGWVVYVYFNNGFHSLVFSSFMGACVVALISEIFARVFKETVTIFVIPGILPLVPGAGMYNTMLAIIRQDFYKSALVGSETIFVAGSIAIGILIVSSVTRMIFQIKGKIQGLQTKSR